MTDDGNGSGEGSWLSEASSADGDAHQNGTEHDDAPCPFSSAPLTLLKNALNQASQLSARLYSFGIRLISLTVDLPKAHKVRKGLYLNERKVLCQHVSERVYP